MAAYTASVAVTEKTVVAGRRAVLVTVTETTMAAGDEYSIPLGSLLPRGIWKVARITLTKIAGTGATFAPVFGRATNPTAGTAAYIGGLGAAAAQDSTNSGIGWLGNGAILYGRSVPNAGADNNVVTQFYFTEGGV